MTKLKRFVLFVVLLVSLQSSAQSFSVIKFTDLQRIMNPANDTTYVINFWATWCMPCVAEFHNFQDIAKAYDKQKLKVIFVSLDFMKDSKKILTPFLTKHKVKEPVYLLNEPDYNSWIDKVDKDWGGEIPATLIINHAFGKKQFIAKAFTDKELETTIQSFLKNK